MYEIKIHNTLGKQVQNLHPIEAGKISFYHCGPTVYWTQHIGNLRGMTMADIIRRSLIFLDYDVNFVRNYTDVGHLTGDNIGDADSGEDRMEKGAKREGLSPDEIAQKYIDVFEKDCAELNILEPTHKPRATEFIAQMQDMVAVLLEKGFAYTTPKAVYFDITKADDYTKLSGQKLEANQIGAGKGDVSDPEKKHPQDFAVWFFKTGVHKKALQTWESPFSSPEVENGRGFPGWHIECSAMARALLDETIDIHMGGIEHIPVHHTNEIAQSESASGKEFVHYWLHNEHLTVDGEKMSKSEGTAYSLAELKAKGFSATDLRYFFLNAHYRSKQNFTWEALVAAQSALANLKKQLLQLRTQSEVEGLILEIWRLKFVEAISKDFSIPAALALVWELLKDNSVAPQDKLETILDFDRVLGLGLEAVALAADTEAKLDIPAEKKTEIELLIAARNKAREDKDWQRADEIRAQLLKEFGIALIDKDGKTHWELVKP